MNLVKHFNGKNVTWKKEDGQIYMKANDIADNQKIADWKRSRNTLEYIQELVNTSENKLWDFSIVSENLIVTKEGRNGGTWIHEKLILDFARYISTKFAIWCDEQLATLLREGAVSIKPKETSIVEDNMIGLKYISDLMKYNDSSKAAMSNKLVKSLGLSNALLIDYVDSKGAIHSATHLLKENNIGLSTIAFNKMLLVDGYLEDKERTSSKGVKKYKVLSDKGLEYGENLVSPANPRETSPMFYDNKFMELYNKVTKE